MFYTTKNNQQKPTATHKKKYHHRSKINVIKYVKTIHYANIKEFLNTLSRGRENLSGEPYINNLNLGYKMKDVYRDFQSASLTTSTYVTV